MYVACRARQRGQATEKRSPVHYARIGRDAAFIGMRTFALLLLASACLSGQPQPKLSPQDESEIRAAIDQQAKKDERKPGGQVWTERGPLIYRVRKLEALAADVAIADVDGVRTGSFPERQPYTLVLTRKDGHWNVVREIAVCTGPGIQLITGTVTPGTPRTR